MSKREPKTASAKDFTGVLLRRSSQQVCGWFCAFSLLSSLLGVAYAAPDANAEDGATMKGGAVTLKSDDRVVLIGNTFAERLQHFGQFESRLQLAKPKLNLTLRNMGWSADEVDLMPRPLDFGELEDHLADKKASVIIMCFGANESFDGSAGLDDFRSGLAGLLDRLEGETFDNRGPVRLVLVSPTAHEKLPAPFPDPRERNAMLEIYSEAMATFAKSRGVPFVDLFHPTLNLMAEHPDIQFTINGIHFTDEGYSLVSDIIATKLGLAVPNVESSTETLRQIVVEKNKQFFFRWRPINGEYVYGRRKEPFGVLSYPPEMAELDRLTNELDDKIHAEAQRLAADAKNEEKAP